MRESEDQDKIKSRTIRGKTKLNQDQQIETLSRQDKIHLKPSKDQSELRQR